MLRVLICVIPQVALFMFIPKKMRVCLLGASFAYVSGFHSVCHFTCFTSGPLTNSWWHRETPRHLAFPSPIPTFLPFFVQSSCWVDDISQLAGIIIHNSGVSLWQSINRKRYPYFLYPPCIHELSLNHYLFIIESPSRDDQCGVHFQPLFRPLHFQCPLPPLSSLSFISPSGYHPFSWGL